MELIYTERNTYTKKLNALREVDKNRIPEWRDFKKAIYEAGTEAGMTRAPLKSLETKSVLECREIRIKQQKKKVWKALRKFLETKSKHDKEDWKKEKIMLTLMLEEKSKKEAEERWKDIEKSNSSAHFWGIINKYRTGRTRKGENITKEEWLKHFNKEGQAANGGHSVHKTNKEENTQDANQEITNNANLDRVREQEETTNDTPTDADLDKDIEYAEVEITIRKLKKGKAVGEDGIKGEFFKNLSKEGKKDLTKTLNSIWTNQKLDEGWKKP